STGVVGGVLGLAGSCSGLAVQPTGLAIGPGSELPPQFDPGHDPRGEEKTPRGRGPVSSTGSELHARSAAPASSAARCSRWRRNGGAGVLLFVDGQVFLVHNRTRPRPSVPPRAGHRPAGPGFPAECTALATTPGRGHPPGS